jgi:hypothetical protein
MYVLRLFCSMQFFIGWRNTMDTQKNIIANWLFRRAIFPVDWMLHSPLFTIFLVLCVLCPGACRRSKPSAPPNESSVSQEMPKTEPNVSQELPKAEPNVSEELPRTEISLFDGKTLGHWKITDFGGQGEVYVKDGAIYLEMGNDMTGINWTGPLVRMNYEITLEAMRVNGSDFFCGLTFPVAENPCSLILGGWGGGVCGLSNIDYYDAANNETTQFISFENGKWYRVRLRVTPDRIEAWLDDEELVNIETTGRKIDIRAEVDLSQPLGIATWQTSGAIRNIKLRRLED